MEYKFRDLEKKWQQKWIEDQVYKVPDHSEKPKYYVLDMFPYPSGAGLHVGHPLGYIASDIFARYKRLKGFNVLHPMGYDAFGLPAEQYALEHGVHPSVSTQQNIATFRSQLDNIGFSFDWSREVKTSDPAYYKWTQWIFLQLFNSWYNRKTNRTEPIKRLVAIFCKEGNSNNPMPSPQGALVPIFSAEAWNDFDEQTREAILMEYRVAYCGWGEVNWCAALGTVLANDEVVNGVSERGGFPVEKKRLRQWYLRITEYANRLLEGLQTVDFSDAMKEMQSNWIGKSTGAEIDFLIVPEDYSQAAQRSSGHYFQTADVLQWQQLKAYAKENRKEATEAEDLLWQNMRDNKLGVKVRRQHAIQGYIVDFALLSEKLIIEIDGEYHNQEEQIKYDRARTAWFNELDLQVLRFTNDEVISNIDQVLITIKNSFTNHLTDKNTNDHTPLLREEKGLGDEAVLTSQPTDTPKRHTGPTVSALANEAAPSPQPLKLSCYTTRPDTIFGVDFLVLAPEHELVPQITTAGQQAAVTDYLTYVKSRSERERMAEKGISGVFTGAHALHPFTNELIPIWIAEYVLAGYGTGAIMAVPSGDERDHKFAKHFNLPITNIAGPGYNGEEAYSSKDLVLEKSGFLTGMNYDGALEVVLQKLEGNGSGRRKVNFKMRDAAFSRQRYWGEPFPIIWNDGVAVPLNESALPLELPFVENYKPGAAGEGPLASITGWADTDIQGTPAKRETNTMPGYAGSSWYFLRYMDPHNDETFCDKTRSSYWNQVDLYVGGTEHAVGHLLYSRMWTKCLYDLNLITFDEPFKRLLNQGMIQGSSRYVYRIDSDAAHFPAPYPVYISERHYKNWLADDASKQQIISLIEAKFPQAGNNTGGKPAIRISPIRVDVNLVDGVDLDITAFRNSKTEYRNALFILEDGSLSESGPANTEGSSRYICGSEVEKMSKSKYNTVNPDVLVQKYGADTFRMYEMFLGPVEMSKPWDTKGIEGVHRFLKKMWRLFYQDEQLIVTDEIPTAAELKTLHKTIKKIEEDTERFSFNTCISAFMVCVNELSDQQCHKREILAPLLVLIAPYAPHAACELWEAIAYRNVNTKVPGIVLDAPFPQWNQQYLLESSKEYPVSVNGKLRTTLHIDLTTADAEVEAMVLNNEVVLKWLEGRSPKKIIFVKGKMINVVV